MLLDLDRRQGSFYAIEYNVDGCRHALEERGLPPDACHLPPTVWQGARRLLRSNRDAVLALAR